MNCSKYLPLKYPNNGLISASGVQVSGGFSLSGFWRRSTPLNKLSIRRAGADAKAPWCFYLFGLLKRLRVDRAVYLLCSPAWVCLSSTSPGCSPCLHSLHLDWTQETANNDTLGISFHSFHIFTLKRHISFNTAVFLFFLSTAVKRARVSDDYILNYSEVVF